eukprot:scaffold6727_cov106-Isochrysis_galbana.AAC.6
MAHPTAHPRAHHPAAPRARQGPPGCPGSSPSLRRSPPRSSTTAAPAGAQKQSPHQWRGTHDPLRDGGPAELGKRRRDLQISGVYDLRTPNNAQQCNARTRLLE